MKKVSMNKVVSFVFKFALVTVLAVFLFIGVLAVTYQYQASGVSGSGALTAEIPVEKEVGIEDIKVQILHELEVPFDEYSRANREAVENFAHNLQADILALKENIPTFVEETTSLTTTFRFAKALVDGWLSDDDDPATALAEELVNEHLLSSGAVEEMIRDNLETLANDLAYNRNRLYAEVRDVVYRKVDNLPLSEQEVREVLESTVAEVLQQSAAIASDGMIASILKEIGSVGLSVVLDSVIMNLVSRFAGWCTSEVATGAAILAVSEGAGSITGIAGLAVGTVIYFVMDYFLSAANERALTEKAEEMIDTLAAHVVYGDNSDGLCYLLGRKVDELTSGDIDYINRMIAGMQGG